MELDDDLCLCFHVTQRKVVNFIRIEKPQKLGQISECGGAGTGCGWCRPYLKQLFEQATGDEASKLPTAEEYARKRSKYVDDGHGTPPG